MRVLIGVPLAVITMIWAVSNIMFFIAGCADANKSNSVCTKPPTRIEMVVIPMLRAGCYMGRPMESWK